MSRTRRDFADLQRYSSFRDFGDVISREESEVRINLLLIISSVVFACFCVVFALTLAALDHEPEEVLLLTSTYRGKTAVHLSFLFFVF